MENLNLNAHIRTTEEKLSEVRASKMVPGVVYGKNQESIVVKVDNSEFLRTYRKSGNTENIKLSVDGKELNVLVKEVQKEPITGSFLHIDFYVA